MEYEVIAHHGVKGQKWGVIRKANKLASGYVKERNKHEALVKETNAKIEKTHAKYQKKLDKASTRYYQKMDKAATEIDKHPDKKKEIESKFWKTEGVRYYTREDALDRRNNEAQNLILTHMHEKMSKHKDKAESYMKQLEDMLSQNKDLMNHIKVKG